MALLRRLLFFCLVLGLAGGVAQAADQAVADKAVANKPVAAKPAEKPPAVVNFGSSENVLELKNALSPYRAPGGGTEADGSSWYIVQVSNDSVRPATRVLMAGQPPRAALSVLPRRGVPDQHGQTARDQRGGGDQRTDGGDENGQLAVVGRQRRLGPGRKRGRPVGRTHADGETDG